LKRLSGDTDGWYEQVDDADRLKRIFLRIFEKVAKPDTVPLKDNKFQIDSSVKEATLLVFRSEGTDPTKVLMPDGSSFSSEDPPKGVSWHRDDGYDLLTIANPKAGVWQIQAEVDPDNRVMVVTDLKMVSNTLPNRLLQGEQKPLKIQFTDRGKKIVNKEFLDVVNMRAEYAGSGSPSEPRPMFDDGKDGDKTAADGEFTHVMSKTIGKGKIELIVTAEGKTFVRERRYTFESIPAVTMERLDGERRGKAGLMATILPEPNLVDGQSIQVEASLIPKEGEPVAVMFLPGIDGMSQETWIDRSALKGEWNLDVHVKAKSVSGVQLELDLDSVLIKGLEPAPEPVAVSEPAKPELKPEPAVEAEPAIEVDPDVEAKPDVEPAPDPVEAKPDTVPLPDEAEDEGGVSSVLWFVLLNLLVVLAGGGAYWYFRKRGAAIYSGLIDDEEEGGADREVVSDNSYAKDIEVEDEDEDEETAECLELTDDDEVGGDADKTVVIGNSEVVAEEAMENSEAEGVVGDEEVTKRDQGEEIIGEGGVEESQSDNS
ncbi:MAG: hypothetical protein GY753_01185, partial [Gammaproteobacteria bacterium]|nr:hypothetical protein [Gammaproteobacteria bacterium]